MDRIKEIYQKAKDYKEHNEALDNNILSYTRILDDMKQFKKSGTKHGYDFNILDMPSQKYFKILFYFGSDSEFSNSNVCGECENQFHKYNDVGGSGLLAPTWEILNVNKKVDEKTKVAPQIELDYYDYNSAWAFLKLNDENERAEKLEQFVTLLSDINTYSPWYFSTLSGISEALERKVTEDEKLEMLPKTLTIGCLPDAFDNRISTLLELYRDITWSWVHKRQIIPANLRKFDMAVYIFETPVNNWTDNAIIDSVSDDRFKPSYKMIEFHNCEFKYNSIKSGLNELTNTTGISPSYKIEITYDDCYEVSYNSVMLRTIGDVILTDMINNSRNDDAYISLTQEQHPNYKSSIESQKLWLDIKLNNGGMLGDLLDLGVGFVGKEIRNRVNKTLMGNLYGFSFTRLREQAKELIDGNVIKSGMTVAQYIKNAKNKNTESSKSPDGNIFEGQIEKPKEEPDGNIFKEVTIQQLIPHKKLGNIFNKSTIANN